MFWSKFDTVNVDTRVMQYSIPDIEHTLSTVGVECNTTVSRRYRHTSLTRKT